ncbi:metallophosphoesterase family protein [Labilibacter marinus]|uniref:metallophosphoesterase n=1 Tax=Labilibacter marinus TaxID=1477105 RepID=UPI000832D36C|nr:metallophosphoesterase [Labilibacter marinus]
MFKHIAVCFLLISITSWVNGQKPVMPSEEPLYTLFMLGDTGEDTLSSMPVLRMVENELKKVDPNNSGLIFLGDNIYPYGLRKKSNENRAEDELRLGVQLDVAKNFGGKSIFISGNHDWDKFGTNGKKALKRQEKYVNKYLDKKHAFLPENGCPGPEVVKLAPGIVMIVIDTQWWLHRYDRSTGLQDDCACRNEEELVLLFKDELKKHRGKHIIIAAHHPLYSNGEHGGNFTPKDHIFPLTHAMPKAYVPLPVLGSIYPFYRKYIGHNQDIAHPVYQDMVNQITKALYEYDDMVYIAGHEHNLQFHQQETVHHIISGAGSKTSPVINNSSSKFAQAQKGYAKLLYYANGNVWLQFFTVENPNSPAYETYLYHKDVELNLDKLSKGTTSYKNKFATVTPNPDYAASAFKRLWFGDLNRDVWTTPIKVPYLDINYEHGGLTPIKKGGGQQTISLRMQGGDGYQYSLRGVRKNSMFLIERNLRGTIAQDVIYDGMAGSHPYAAVTIPKLSKAADIYYAQPTLVYVPKDSVLGTYMEEFGGMFCLLEERPDNDMSAWDNFGNSKKVLSYSDAIEDMQTHHKHVVDKDYMVRARLFDILIGDWDRHDDQWRWATFKEDGKTIYRAIPRDRDQAFFQYDGALLSISNRKWLLRKFQPFRNEVRDMAGLGFNARFFDRAFLTEASLNDWLIQANYIKNNVTDEVIEEAIRELPQAGFEVNGEYIISTLKARRDQMEQFAKEYYQILSKTVSIHGTLDDDYIDVIRKEDGSVSVNMYPRKKGKRVKKKQFFSRTFNINETNEIRIYGLEGSDEYRIKGEVSKSIKVRIIAGEDKDKIVDESKVSGLRKYTLVYDDKGKSAITTSNETKVKKLSSKKAYDYDRKDFKYNHLMPLISTGYNKDDGFYLGPGFKYIRYGFKKEPYKYYHKLLMNRAFDLNAYNFFYDFDYRELIGPFDLSGSAHIKLPDIYMNFSNVNDENINFDDLKYSALMNDYNYNLSLKLSSDNQAHLFKFGVNYQHVDFEKIPQNISPSWETQAQNYISPAICYSYQNVDNKAIPHRGLKFYVNLEYKTSTNTNNVNVAMINTYATLYTPIYLTSKQTTLALRTGFDGNFGVYAFYQSNYINPSQNFRGVQRNRFTAKSFLYQNIELRQSLFKVPNYITPFDFGFIGHFDLIKLWKPDILDERWYTSYGVGAFVNILDSFIINGTYSISEQNNLFTLGTSFLF